MSRVRDEATPQHESRFPARDVLEEVVSPERVARIDHVLTHRLVSLTAVFENIFDPHNVGACLRTCEGFGLQDAHVITEQHGYKPPTSITMSSDRWMTLHRHKTTAGCVEALRAQGFELWVSDLEAESALSDLPLPPKLAIVMGNERDGITETMRAAADRRFVLPMTGMVQSFNLSVALALCLNGTVDRWRARLGAPGDMPLSRQWRLRRRWLERGVRQATRTRVAYGDAGEEAAERIALELEARERDSAALTLRPPTP